MSAVPRRFARRYYSAKAGLKQLLQQENPDELQKAAVDLVSLLSDRSGLDAEDFGVTGSLLAGIHKPNFSDIDLVVYGRKEALRLKRILMSLYRERAASIKRLPQPTLSEWAREKASIHPVSFREALQFYRLKWNYGIFEKYIFSIHPVRRDDELTERYGDRTYKPLGIDVIVGRVSDVSESMFLPHTYGISKVKSTSERRLGGLKEVVSYEGFYHLDLHPGERVIARGKIEQVTDRRRQSEHLRLVVGSLEANGKDFLKPYDLHFHET